MLAAFLPKLELAGGVAGAARYMVHKGTDSQEVTVDGKRMVEDASCQSHGLALRPTSQRGGCFAIHAATAIPREAGRMSIT